jgi:hypothetical protein
MQSLQLSHDAQYTNFLRQSCLGFPAAGTMLPEVVLGLQQRHVLRISIHSMADVTHAISSVIARLSVLNAVPLHRLKVLVRILQVRMNNGMMQSKSGQLKQSLKWNQK